MQGPQHRGWFHPPSFPTVSWTRLWQVLLLLIKKIILSFINQEKGHFLTTMLSCIRPFLWFPYMCRAIDFSFSFLKFRHDEHFHDLYLTFFLLIYWLIPQITTFWIPGRMPYSSVASTKHQNQGNWDREVDVIWSSQFQRVRTWPSLEEWREAWWWGSNWDLTSDPQGGGGERGRGGAGSQRDRVLTGNGLGFWNLQAWTQWHTISKRAS